VITGFVEVFEIVEKINKLAQFGNKQKSYTQTYPRFVLKMGFELHILENTVCCMTKNIIIEQHCTLVVMHLKSLRFFALIPNKRRIYICLLKTVFCLLIKAQHRVEL
jgi:hypothetical protein